MNGKQIETGTCYVLGNTVRLPNEFHVAWNVPMESMQKWCLVVNYHMKESSVFVLMLMRLVMWMIENKKLKIKFKNKCVNNMKYVQVCHMYDNMYMHLFGCMIEYIVWMWKLDMVQLSFMNIH